MKFLYSALTTDNKKINGVLDAPDRDTAVAELHKMGVAILSVNEISAEEYVKFQQEQEEQKTKRGIKTYQFLAVDNNAKEVEGTIDSVDDFSAYRRLREEYQFKVLNLFPETATEAEREQAKALVPGLEDQLAQVKAQEKKRDEHRQTSKEAMAEGEVESDKAIVAEIDRVIINAKKMLQEHADIFSSDLLVEAQNTLNELERVRTSNNLKHITEVSNDLYALISNPDKADSEKLRNGEYQALLGEFRDSALVRKEFELYKKAVEASGLRRVFSDLAKRMKELTAPKEEGAKPKGVLAKLRAYSHGLLEKTSKKPKAARKETRPKSRFGVLAEKLNAYMAASSPILKKTRQRELMSAIKSLFWKKGAEEAVEGIPKPAEAAKKAAVKKVAEKMDIRKSIGGFFVEADSFVSWLLCFYILYFFLVDFSLEKRIGLSREFVYRTLKTPLLLNITLLLLLLHFALRFRNLHLGRNVLASLFLLFFTIGAYVLVLVNF